MVNKEIDPNSGKFEDIVERYPAVDEELLAAARAGNFATPQVFASAHEDYLRLAQQKGLTEQDAQDLLPRLISGRATGIEFYTGDG